MTTPAHHRESRPPQAAPSRWARWRDAAVAHPYRAVGLLFALCLAGFVATLPLPRDDGLLVGSDGIGYFANLRSLVFDGDLDLRNDYVALLGQAPPLADTPKYTVGLAVLWLPFYLIAHVVVLAAAALGFPVATDGYAVPYQVAACLGSMAYGLAGMLLTLRLCREWFEPATALLATVLAWLATGAVYYLAVENSMAHACSIALVAALIALWRLGRDQGPLVYWGGMGLLVGVAAMVRPQDAAFVLLPGLTLLGAAAAAARARSVARARDVAIGGLLLAAGAALGYAPQFAASQTAYESPLASGYIEHGESFTWGSPHLLDVLFSNWHGLLTWHPILLAALAGLVVLGRRDRAYALALAAAFAVQLYIVAAWQIWWAGDAFGSRMLLNCLPIFALGLAGAIAWLRGRSGWRPVLAVAVVVVAWNGLFMAQYRSGAISRGDPVSWHDMTVGKFSFLADQVRKRL